MMQQSLVLSQTGVENNGYGELLMTSIQSLWTTRQMVDITFQVDSQEIQAHQVVLASSSPELMDALTQIQKTTRNAVLDLNAAGVTMVGLRELLNYLYFGKMKLADNLHESVAKAARTLHIPRVVALCELYKTNFCLASAKNSLMVNPGQAPETAEPSSSPAVTLGPAPIPMVQKSIYKKPVVYIRSPESHKTEELLRGGTISNPKRMGVEKPERDSVATPKPITQSPKETNKPLVSLSGKKVSESSGNPLPLVITNARTLATTDGNATPESEYLDVKSEPLDNFPCETTDEPTSEKMCGEEGSKDIGLSRTAESALETGVATDLPRRLISVEEIKREVINVKNDPDSESNIQVTSVTFLDNPRVDDLQPAPDISCPIDPVGEKISSTGVDDADSPLQSEGGCPDNVDGLRPIESALQSCPRKSTGTIRKRKASCGSVPIGPDTTSKTRVRVAISPRQGTSLAEDALARFPSSSRGHYMHKYPEKESVASDTTYEATVPKLDKSEEEGVCPPSKEEESSLNYSVQVICSNGPDCANELIYPSPYRNSSNFIRTCVFCDFRFRTTSSCEQHVLLKHFSKPFVFEDSPPPANIRERNEVEKESRKGYMCSICQYFTTDDRFIFFHRYYRHSLPMAANLIEPYCQDCGVLLPKDTDMAEHVAHHVDHYICTKCFKRYLSLALLTKHIRADHSDKNATGCIGNVRFVSHNRTAAFGSNTVVNKPDLIDYCVPNNI